MNQLFKIELVSTDIGGAGGGGARLTPAGDLFLSEYTRLSAELSEAVDRFGRHLAGARVGDESETIWNGIVAQVEDGELQLVTERGLPVVASAPMNADVTTSPPCGSRMMIHIPDHAVLLAADGLQETSARNNWRGEVVRRSDDRGASHIDLRLTSGDGLRTLVTTASADRLGLKVGAATWAIIKAAQIKADAFECG